MLGHDSPQGAKNGASISKLVPLYFQSSALPRELDRLNCQCY